MGTVRKNIPDGLPPQEGLCLTRYLLVMVHLPLVDEHAAILWDVVAIQHRVLGCAGERKDGELGKSKGSSASSGACQADPAGCDPKGWF